MAAIKTIQIRTPYTRSDEAIRRHKLNVLKGYRKILSPKFKGFILFFKLTA